MTARTTTPEHGTGTRDRAFRKNSLRKFRRDETDGKRADRRRRCRRCRVYASGTTACAYRSPIRSRRQVRDVCALWIRAAGTLPRASAAEFSPSCVGGAPRRRRASRALTTSQPVARLRGVPDVVSHTRKSSPSPVTLRPPYVFIVPDPGVRNPPCQRIIVLFCFGFPIPNGESGFFEGLFPRRVAPRKPSKQIREDFSKTILKIKRLISIGV